MPLMGFGIDSGNGKPPPGSQGPDFAQLVKDERRLADRLAPPKKLKRWKSASAPQQGTTAGYQKSGTVYIVNTDQDEINSLTVTVLSGTLWVFLQEQEPNGSEIPDYAFGALSPVTPLVIPVPLDRYFVTFYAKGADCGFSVLGQAL
jgi:hypothetical protein